MLSRLQPRQPGPTVAATRYGPGSVVVSLIWMVMVGLSGCGPDNSGANNSCGECGPGQVCIAGQCGYPDGGSGMDGSANNGDVDGSGLVDVDDLTTVILAWGPCE